MENNWIVGITDVAALPMITPLPAINVEGKIKINKLPGPTNMPSVVQIPVRDDIEITKIKEYVKEEDLNPQTWFANWSKKHPTGQDAPMRSENKMISHERKLNK
tara:strand:+ start:5092 stop:5403 length:312 start_codon:yes stop_codon:yes gene_type:complete